MSSEKKYIYCNVLPSNFHTPYYYICDFDVKPGDIVIVSFRTDDNIKAALVLDVNEYTKSTVPYPLERTKHILRKFGNTESADLNKQLEKLNTEKAKRFYSDGQSEKLSIKKSLTLYGIGKKAIRKSKAKLIDLLKSIPDKNNATLDFIGNLSDDIRFSNDIQLSNDGKTVTGFNSKKGNERVVINIPSGVETIEDNAFLRVKIDELFIPKELKEIGTYTIHDENGVTPKDIRSIEVEDGNEHYYADSIGFYSFHNGKKHLEFILDKNLTKYICPDDVKSIARSAFDSCPNLKNVILSDGIEEFNEYCLPYDTQIEEIYFSKTVRHLHFKSPNVILYGKWNRPFYRIDEESEYLFRDEDSIYEILEDGTYKLLINLYHGKGRVLILEGTSIIGESAFEGHKNISSVEFPKSLRVIEKRAFCYTAVTSLIVPDHIQRIEANAFLNCSSLKSVQLSANIEYLAEDAFQECCKLQEIKSDGLENPFIIENGIVRKFSTVGRMESTVQPTSTDMIYPWISGKIFVHTGFQMADERKFEAIVKANGGIIKNSTVKGTDYLVYNEYYDHVTTKLEKAKQLKGDGKAIRIITQEEWNNLLESNEPEKFENITSTSEIIDQQSPAKDYFDEFVSRGTLSEEKKADFFRNSFRQHRAKSELTACFQRNCCIIRLPHLIPETMNDRGFQI